MGVSTPKWVQGYRRALAAALASLSRHPQIQAAVVGAGGGAGALQTRQDAAPLPAPWGSLQMPGVILSQDQWAIFGDTDWG